MALQRGAPAVVGGLSATRVRFHANALLVAGQLLALTQGTLAIVTGINLLHGATVDSVASGVNLAGVEQATVHGYAIAILVLGALLIVAGITVGRPSTPSRVFLALWAGAAFFVTLAAVYEGGSVLGFISVIVLAAGGRAILPAAAVLSFEAVMLYALAVHPATYRAFAQQQAAKARGHPLVAPARRAALPEATIRPMLPQPPPLWASATPVRTAAAPPAVRPPTAVVAAAPPAPVSARAAPTVPLSPASAPTVVPHPLTPAAASPAKTPPRRRPPEGRRSQRGRPAAGGNDRALAPTAQALDDTPKKLTNVEAEPPIPVPFEIDPRTVDLSAREPLVREGADTWLTDEPPFIEPPARGAAHGSLQTQSGGRRQLRGPTR